MGCRRVEDVICPRGPRPRDEAIQSRSWRFHMQGPEFCINYALAYGALSLISDDICTICMDLLGGFTSRRGFMYPVSPLQ